MLCSASLSVWTFPRLRASKVRESIPYVGFIPKVIIPLNLVLVNSQVSEFPGRSRREANPLKHILLTWTARGQRLSMHSLSHHAMRVLHYAREDWKPRLKIT